MRALAKEKKMSILEFNKSIESDPAIDSRIDSWVERLGKTEDNFVMDSRLAFHFIPQSLKIFLTADFDVRAQRIFKDDRVSEEYQSLRALKEAMDKREKSELKRYKKLYNLNYNNQKIYDLVIDTTKRSVQQVVDEILRFVKRRE